MIEAVITCVNYSDFLAHTLPLNKGFFEKMVVVSNTTDKATHRLCAHLNVRCIQTDHFYENDQAFNKANGINAGLRQLDLSDWAVHLDADIVLPPRFREIVDRIDLDPECIYGLDRMMCGSFEEWQDHVANPEIQHTSQIFVTANRWRLGTRVAKLGEDGYVPIGFFQMWNPGKTGNKIYPNKCGDAGRTDMLFALQWPRRRRLFIPEIVAIHLSSEPGVLSANWRGRVSGHFGCRPCDPPDPLHKPHYRPY